MQVADVHKGNYYNFLQARNDSDLIKKNIQINKRSNHIVHDYYLSEKYSKINHLPTIFYINEKSSLISNNDDLPVFSIENMKVQSDFRPALSDFDPLLSCTQFKQYLSLRNKIYSNYTTELKRSNIHSFDEIDISKIISLDLSLSPTGPDSALRDVGRSTGDDFPTTT